MLAKQRLNPSTNANKDVNMDVGERVAVEAWNADGTAQVQYRGASWAAVLAPGRSPAPGMHVIAEVHGSRLTLNPV